MKGSLMKHPLLYLLSLCLLCLSCSEEQGDRALVSGTIRGLGTDTLIIYGADQMFDHVDTLYVKKDKFKRFITVDTLAQAWIMYRDGSRVPLYLDKRSRITIQGDTAHLQHLHIDDQAENTLLTQFTAQHDTLLTVALADTFITHHPTSTVGFYLVQRLLLDADAPQRRQLSTLLSKMDEELQHHPQYLSLTDRLKQEAKADSGTSVGYFRYRNLDGKWLSRADFSKHWLLIHFWATWDAASRRQLRTLYKPLYADLKKQKLDTDLQLWGISLDIDRQQWQQAIQADTLQWPQGCDAKGWLTDGVTQLNIRYLPTNVLITPDGKVQAYNLTREQIDEKIKEIKEEKRKSKK